MASRTATSIHTAETLMRELIESSKRFEKLFSRLKGTGPASETCFELLGELWAESELIKTKAEDCKQVTDELMNAFPD
ncbi:MAG: hypothetical protein ACRD19_07385 [Terriglobia bacterium]